jgi:opacity protein-like surface antigen
MESRLRSILVAAFLVLAPAAASAQTLADYDYENLSFRGIGVDYGWVWPNKVEPAHTWGLRLDLGFLGPAVRIAPSVTYWSSRMKRSELERFAHQLRQLPGVSIDADDLGVIDWGDLAFSVDAQGVFTVPGNVILFAGGGIGIHALNGSGSAVDDTFIEDLLDTVAAGFAVMAGAEYEPIRHLRVYGEGRYALTSDVRYPQVRIGAAFMLPGGSNAAARSAR